MKKRITIQKIINHFDYEYFRLKFGDLLRKSLSKYRNKKLINKDFTIISNNCWAGMVYESYNLPKMTPTVGLFFMADDYLNFIGDLHYYTSKELTFISPNRSKYYEQLKNSNRFGEYPIGILDDVEVFFLHYHSEEEAKSKWTRRCKRINWDRLIVKMDDQNGCQEFQARIFSKLSFKNKLFFTIHNDWNIENWGGYYVIEQHTKDSSITASHMPFGSNKYFDLTTIINSL